MAWLAAVGLALGLAGAAVIVATGSGSLRPPADLSPAEAEAIYAACQDFVRPQLPAKGPVTFSPIRRRTVRYYGDGRAYVRAHADATNGAGRLVEFRFACTLRPQDGTRWTLEGLSVSTD
jgi:hypothetical protein